MFRKSKIVKYLEGVEKMSERMKNYIENLEILESMGELDEDSFLDNYLKSVKEYFEKNLEVEKRYEELKTRGEITQEKCYEIIEDVYGSFGNFIEESKEYFEKSGEVFENIGGVTGKLLKGISRVGEKRIKKIEKEYKKWLGVK